MARIAYPTDLTDAQPRIIEKRIPAAKPGGRPRSVDVRELVNGILYLVLELGIELICRTNLARVEGGEAVLSCIYTGRETRRSCAAIVPVTMRLPVDGLYRELVADRAALDRAGIKGVTAIGDCWAPSTIAAAVYAGHRYPREMDTVPDPDGVSFKRELVLGR